MSSMMRPKFDQLSAEEQALLRNGAGPYWFADWLRKLITNTASFFFKSASWDHHDFGYVVGGDGFDRMRCDWKFLKAMLRDAINQPIKYALITCPIAVIISIVFYMLVAAFGWRSFAYRNNYATLQEIKDQIKKAQT